MRELLRHAGEHFEVVECPLATFGFARPQDLATSCSTSVACLPAAVRKVRRWRASMPKRERRTHAAAISASLSRYTCSPASTRERTTPNSSSWRTEVGRRGRALAQLGEVDLVLAALVTRAAPLRALGGGSGPSSSSRITRSGRNSSLESQDRRQALDVVGREEPVAAPRTARGDEAWSRGSGSWRRRYPGTRRAAPRRPSRSSAASAPPALPHLEVAIVLIAAGRSAGTCRSGPRRRPPAWRTRCGAGSRTCRSGSRDRGS